MPFIRSTPPRPSLSAGTDLLLFQGTIFRYSTKARSTLEAPLDVVLAGLSSSSPDDVFGIEIQPPASHRLVVNSALKIVPVSTSLASPKHPLKFKVIFTPQKVQGPGFSPLGTSCLT